MFDLQARGTNVRIEVLAGLSTFMTMSYIIFVQPAVLSICGMDHGAVLVATCVASAIATFLMGVLANYPIALAPAMGHNFFFVFTICGIMGYSWQVALGANFISGALFLFLSVFSFRARLVDSIPQSIKSAIAVGIGLLIALVGMEWSGLVVGHPATLVQLGNLHSPPVLISLLGVLLISVLFALRVRGAILIGILATAFLGWLFGLVNFEGVVSAPPSIAPTFLKLDIAGVFTTGGFVDVLMVIFVFFFLDLFDTVGTLVGISQRAGLVVDGKLPRAERALLSDAIGTVVGTTLGTSTVTSYIESAAGVSEGGRTGLTAVTTGVLFLLALFFAPLAAHIPAVATAPALVIVGVYMMEPVVQIDFGDFREAIPAFLTIAVMPLAFSISEGIAVGILAFTFLRLVSGGHRQIGAALWILSGLFVLHFILR